MPPERTYRTDSGSYTESELSVLVWLNPDQHHRPNSRLLATYTDKKSPHPMAFPTKILLNTSEFMNAHLATEDSLTEALLASSSTAPVIVSLSLARASLGWTDFFISTTYTEEKQ